MGAAKQPKAAPVAAQTPQYGSNYQQGTTTTSQQFTPWAQAQPTYDAMANQMNAQAARGPQYVGQSVQTQQGWNAAQAAIPGMRGAANTALGNYGFLSRAADVANNPYVQGMMGNNRAAAQRSLTEDFLPALGNQSQAAGGMEGPGRGSRRAWPPTAQCAPCWEANNSLAMGAYSQGLGAQQSALGSLGGAARLMAPGAALGAIGQAREGYQQAARAPCGSTFRTWAPRSKTSTRSGPCQARSNASSYSASGPQGAYGPNGAVPTPAAAQYPQYPQQGASPYPYGDQPPSWQPGGQWPSWT